MMEASEKSCSPSVDTLLFMGGSQFPELPPRFDLPIYHYLDNGFIHQVKLARLIFFSLTELNGGDYLCKLQLMNDPL